GEVGAAAGEPAAGCVCAAAYTREKPKHINTTHNRFNRFIFYAIPATISTGSFNWAFASINEPYHIHNFTPGEDAADLASIICPTRSASHKAPRSMQFALSSTPKSFNWEVGKRITFAQNPVKKNSPVRAG
ncbi:MAG: hypothetical protein WBD91_00410, partial [Acidobacteriaceae bacterium]